MNPSPCITCLPATHFTLPQLGENTKFILSHSCIQFSDNLPVFLNIKTNLLNGLACSCEPPLSALCSWPHWSFLNVYLRHISDSSSQFVPGYQNKLSVTVLVVESLALIYRKCNTCDLQWSKVQWNEVFQTQGFSICSVLCLEPFLLCLINSNWSLRPTPSITWNFTITALFCIYSTLWNIMLTVLHSFVFFD